VNYELLTAKEGIGLGAVVRCDTELSVFAGRDWRKKERTWNYTLGSLAEILIPSAYKTSIFHPSPRRRCGAKYRIIQGIQLKTERGLTASYGVTFFYLFNVW